MRTTASTVVVIGNGFDLNLGLNTSYRNFLDSQHFPDSRDPSTLAGHLKATLALQNWVDVEVELANFSSRNSKRPSVKAEYAELRKCLITYIASIDTENMDSRSHAYRLLQNHVVGSDFQIINFNYTNSVETALKQLHVAESDFQDRIRSVHGTCALQDIVFGVDDSASVALDHVFLFKSTAGNFSASGITSLLRTAKVIHFFGHSLGHPDHMYFTDFFRALVSSHHGLNIHFHHYTESGMLDLHKQLRAMSFGKVAKLKSNATIHFHDVSIPPGA